MISVVSGQNYETKNLDYFLNRATHDSDGVKYLCDASNRISFFNPDSGMVLAEKALSLARDIHYRKGEADALNVYERRIIFWEIMLRHLRYSLKRFK